MKQNNFLRTLTIILIIILLSIISFIGIYQKKLNKYENVIPDYQTGMEFGKRREVILKVDDTTETVYYDAEGNVVEHTHEEGEEHSEDEELPEGQTTKEVPINSQDILIAENFNLTKTIIENRLNDFQVPEYDLRKGENGTVWVSLPENSLTDTYVQLIAANGGFELIDSDTNEVLLNSNNIKTTDVLYNTTENGTTVYLNIEFKKEDRAKLEEISKTYVKTQDEEGNDTTKNVTLKLDDEILTTTYFGQTMSNGILQLPLGSNITTQEELENIVTEATLISTLIKQGELPIQYVLEYNNTINPNITETDIKIVSVIAIISVGIMIIYLIIRNDINGLNMGIGFVGFIAILLLFVRYGNCIITTNSIMGIIIISIFEYLFLLSYLKNLRKNKENISIIFKDTYFKYLKLGIPLCAVAIVFTFSKLSIINSFGMIVFWGIITFLLYNLVTIKYLTITKNK